jgi:hypothetical protein
MSNTRDNDPTAAAACKQSASQLHADVYLTVEQCMRLEPHPLAAKYQRMSEAQYSVLLDDVALVGVQRPITIDSDARFAVDGIHRARAGAETGRGASAMQNFRVELWIGDGFR